MSYSVWKVESHRNRSPIDSFTSQDCQLRFAPRFHTDCAAFNQGFSRGAAIKMGVLRVLSCPPFYNLVSNAAVKCKDLNYRQVVPFFD